MTLLGIDSIKATTAITGKARQERIFQQMNKLQKIGHLQAAHLPEAKSIPM